MMKTTADSGRSNNNGTSDGKQEAPIPVANDTIGQMIQGFFDVLLSNRLFFAGFLALALALGGGFYYYRSHLVKVEENAQSVLFEAKQETMKVMDVLAAEIGKEKAAQNVNDKALNKSKDEAAGKGEEKDFAAAQSMPLNVDEKFKPAVEKYRAVIDQFPGTRASIEAALGLGDMYFDHGEVSKSIPFYEKALSFSKNETDVALSHIALGTALEETKDFPKALDHYLKVISSKDEGIKLEGMFAAARIYKLQGDKDKASKQYDEVIQKFPNSENSKQAEMLKAQLEIN